MLICTHHADSRFTRNHEANTAPSELKHTALPAPAEAWAASNLYIQFPALYLLLYIHHIEAEFVVMPQPHFSSLDLNFSDLYQPSFPYFSQTLF